MVKGKSLSKVIGTKDSSYASWQAPEVNTQATVVTSKNMDPRRRPPTAEEIEQIHKKAHQEGFAQGQREGTEKGRAAGMAQGQKLVQAQVQHLKSAFDTLASPLEQLDEEIEQELLNLCMAVAKQIVRREIKTDPGQVIAVVRDAVSLLPVAAREVKLHLHPEDAALVKQSLSIPEGEQRWQIIDDPVLSRGDCKVETESSRINATLDQRIAEIAAAVFGGEREHDDG